MSPQSKTSTHATRSNLIEHIAHSGPPDAKTAASSSTNTPEEDVSKMSLPVRVRVKICGITSLKDAEAAISAGADALGFNTWSGSRRYLDLETAAEWIADLPCFVMRVALCVNMPQAQAKLLGTNGLVDMLQFHGDESREYCDEFAALKRPFMRAVRLGAANELDTLPHWGTRNVLVDAAVPGAYGGTGCSADLALAAEAVVRFPRLAITLAGGLEPHNVAAAVRRVRPYAVDVASGVESAPGKKDPAKMRDFVQAVLGA